jgi:cell division protein ZapA
MDQSRVVSVEIHGQQYPIRSGLDPAYVAELAAYVDEKMRLAARESTAGETLKLAVLAALNIADEYFRECDEQRRRTSTIASRAGELERMLDLALGYDEPFDAAQGEPFDGAQGEPFDAARGRQALAR